MNTSRFLSKVLGIYLIIISMMLFTNMHMNVSLIHALIGNAPLMYVTGFFTVILGLLMVVSHNIWEWNWRVIITIIAWIILLKGLSILFFPHMIDKTTMLFLRDIKLLYVSAGIDLILGVALTYFGFKK